MLECIPMPLIEQEANYQEGEPSGRIKNVGLDMDGNLLDTAEKFPVIFGSFVEQEFGIPQKIGGGYFLDTQGIATHEQIRGLLVARGFVTIPDNETLLKMGVYVDEQLGEAPGDPFPEIPEALHALQEEGYRLFVSSSHKDDIIGRKLQQAGLAPQYIRYWIGKDSTKPELKKGKPHFAAAAAHFGVPYERFTQGLVYIGDAPSDISSTLEAGVTAIGRTGSRSRERLLQEGQKYGTEITIVDNFRDLPQILRTL